MDFLKNHGLRVLFGLIISVPFVLQSAGVINLQLLRTLEYFAYDSRLKLTLPGTVDARIVIVDIDEKSLGIEGRWPWGRDRMATLVDNLFSNYEVSVVGFDMVFAEEERHSAFTDLETVLRERGEDALANEVEQLSPKSDAQFSDSLSGRDVALGFYFSPNSSQTGVLPDPYLPGIIAEELNIPAHQAFGYGGNLEIFQSSAKAGGFFDNPLSDEDGVFRRAPMVQSLEGDIYESLSLAVIQTYLKQPFSIDENNEWLFIGDQAIPVDGQMAALVPYRGSQGSFPYVSATDVLNNTVESPERLKDAIVLIGTTAPGLYDLRSTPVQKVYAGVEIHANLISGMLDNRFLSQPSYTAAAELIAMSLVALLLCLVLPMLGATASTLLCVATLGVLIGANLMLWTRVSVVTTLAPGVLMILALYLYNMASGFISESRNRQALARRFGQYVPPELVKKMSVDPDQYSMAGERREMTVLFSDVKGFSNLAENMDPEQLSELMNNLLTRLTRVIHENRGTIDKYMGDAVMAFWGAPLHDDGHAAGAVESALKMIAAIDASQEEFRAKGWPEIGMGIGLNSGPMNVGDMGSEFRMAYTVMGDAVNLGSRLEGLTRAYGVNVVVSEYTVAAAPGFLYRLLDRVRVKGRDTPVDIYEPLCPLSEATDSINSELEAYNHALDLYRTAQWTQAREEFKSLSERFGDQELYRMYALRSEHFLKVPPSEGWDGVFDFKTK